MDDVFIFFKSGPAGKKDFCRIQIVLVLTHQIIVLPPKLFNKSLNPSLQTYRFLVSLLPYFLTTFEAIE